MALLQCSAQQQKTIECTIAVNQLVDQSQRGEINQALVLRKETFLREFAL